MPRLVLAFVALGAPAAHADVVTEWNVRACEWVTTARLPTPPANRVMAISHTAAYEAANAITQRYPRSPGMIRIDVRSEASVEAAIAAALHTTLARSLPAQQPAIDEAYRTALATIGDGPAREAGIAVGRQAATLVLAARADDGAAATEAYRPRTIAGAYVPTAIPAVPQWPQRKPWLLASASQFRPGPPPLLSSERWARDLNEIKAIGARTSTSRNVEQTEVARFWETTGPPIYHALVRSVTEMPGRDVMANARLFAAATQAIDDALIAVFDAKYHYDFWRPVTAIRNGDLDGNHATGRDPAWQPLIDTPMHPEYPCAHCIQAAAVGTLLQAEIGTGPSPTFVTTSPTANNAARRWSSAEAFMREVAEARIRAGVHYRFSTEAGLAMGRRIGALTAERFRLAMPTASVAEATEVRR